MSKYDIEIKGVTVDVYDILKAADITSPALQHLIKKALHCGKRRHKDQLTDLNDILASAKRAVELANSDREQTTVKEESFNGVKIPSWTKYLTWDRWGNCQAWNYQPKAEDWKWYTDCELVIFKLIPELEKIEGCDRWDESMIRLSK